MKKFAVGFVAGFIALATSQVIAACFRDGELITGVNIMLMDTGTIIHCPTVSFMMDGRHINCNR